VTEEWDFYPLLVDGEPASIFLDMGVARTAPVRGYNRMAYLRVHMLRPRGDGLSSQEEYDDLVKLEDTVTSEVIGASRTLYVGRNTSHGNRDFYFYTGDERGFATVAKSAMEAFPQYDFELGGRPDREWRTYFDFLYPSPEQRRCMLNRAVLDRLAESGDDHDARRPIDHTVIFKSAAPCAAFAKHVRSLGFQVEEGSPAIESGGLALSFFRADAPAEIDDITLMLRRAAIRHSGEYDGWGCHVVTNEDAQPSGT
jgi:uncharacterized protein (TIGR01619 family)